MFLCHSIYPLPRDGTFSAHINGEHDHDSRHKSYYQKEVRKPSFGAMPNPNIPGLAIVLNNTLPPDSLIPALEPPLSSLIMHGLLL